MARGSGTPAPEERAALKKAVEWFVDVEESSLGRRSSVSGGHRCGGRMLLVYGLDGEKLREFPSDSFSSQLLRLKRTLSTTRSGTWSVGTKLTWRNLEKVLGFLGSGESPCGALRSLNLQ